MKVTIVVIVLIVVGVQIGVRTVILGSIRGSSARADPETTADGALFVVRNRTWTWMMWRVLGIVLLLLGAIFVVVAAGSDDVDVPMSIAGVSLVVAAALGLWFAHCLRRVGLEVLPGGSVRVTTMVHAAGTVSLADATALRRYPSNYGGLDVRAGRRRLLTADRSQLGYAQLIEYIAQWRPDLEIPEECRPL